jgi:hypothetical protein
LTDEKKKETERYFYPQWLLFLNVSEEQHESFGLIIHHNNKNIYQVGGEVKNAK